MNAIAAGQPDTGTLTAAQLRKFKQDAADAEQIDKTQREKDAKHQETRAIADQIRADEAQESLREIESLEVEVDRILSEGQPFEYFLKTFQLDHEGDLTAARCMALVFASSSVANGDGLHCYLSGSSGRGKTHAAEMMFKQLPDEYRYNRSFSDKYLFYAGNDAKSGLKEGVVILLDDQTMSESNQEIFKVAVSKFSDPRGVVYGTVLSQKAITLNMPPRISWVLLKVDDPGDDQVMNRVIQARIQETDEKIKDSAKKIQEKYRNLQRKNIASDSREVRICRSMWHRIKGARVAVEVPCAGHVNFADYENLRNHELFFNLIMAHTIIHRWQREEIGRTEDDIPIIQAIEADFKEARLIYESLHTFGGQKHNTLKNEDLVIEALIKMNPEKGLFTIKQAAELTELNYKSCLRALNGREGSGKVKGEMGGLLDKCPFIQKLGKRGQYELQTDVEYIQGNGRTGEIVRKESFNEDIYHVNVGALMGWKNNGIPVWLTPDFKWEASSK